MSTASGSQEACLSPAERKCLEGTASGPDSTLGKHAAFLLERRRRVGALLRSWRICLVRPGAVLSPSVRWGVKRHFAVVWSNLRSHHCVPDPSHMLGIVCCLHYCCTTHVVRSICVDRWRWRYAGVTKDWGIPPSVSIWGACVGAPNTISPRAQRMNLSMLIFALARPSGWPSEPCPPPSWQVIRPRLGSASLGFDFAANSLISVSSPHPWDVWRSNPAARVQLVVALSIYCPKPLP